MEEEESEDLEDIIIDDPTDQQTDTTSQVLQGFASTFDPHGGEHFSFKAPPFLHLGGITPQTGGQYSSFQPIGKTTLTGAEGAHALT